MYDCVLFDIDGVLVDIRKSYNAAIKETVEYMLKFITGSSFQRLSHRPDHFEVPAERWL